MDRPVRQLLADRSRSRLTGVAVAALAIALTTVVISPLREVAPAVSTGVLYLLAVLLVSTLWGTWLGLATAVASALAWGFFHLPPTGRFTIADPENLVALAVFLASAVVASTVADLVRATAAEAERRREEADLAAELARVLLGEASVEEALPVASSRLAAALGIPYAAIVLDHLDSPDRQAALPLDVGHGRDAALQVPSGLPPATMERLRERVAPALQALVAAALDRDRLQAEVVETHALRRSDVIKTALLRAVSHDLRTPLTAILAAGESLRSPSVRPDERDELGAVVVEEAQRLSRLIDKLLDLSRLQAGEAEARRDWCSIEEVVEGALEHVEAAVPVEVALDRDLPLVQADAAQLERVLANLIENAQRFSGGHPVKLRARVTGGRLTIRVIDRGPGIPAEMLPRVFEPFRRAAADGEHRGSGLGLAIVKGFVEANGGRVWAESLPRQGTVFVVQLPLSPQPAAHA
jgi:two-component system, OmpR family, sensor histidine kinase KdpD